MAASLAQAGQHDVALSAVVDVTRSGPGPHLEVAYNMGMLQAGQRGDLPNQAGEALRGLGLHLDLLHCILAAVQAIDGSHYHPIPTFAQAAQLLKVALIP